MKIILIELHICSYLSVYPYRGTGIACYNFKGLIDESSRTSFHLKQMPQVSLNLLISLRLYWTEGTVDIDLII